MGETQGAPVLTNGRRNVRIVAAADRVIAQMFEGDPALGGKYIGSSVYHAKTLDQVVAIYAGRGWTPTGALEAGA